MKNSTSRFSDRVENYIRYRPGYPDEVVGVLKTDCGLAADQTVADIGSGTGILTKSFLENGNTVYAVEPNKEMREAGERLLQGYSGFVSVAGTAEQTGLEGRSIDLIAAGQAFHWFDPDRCKSEFKRILRKGGWVALVWNERLVGPSPFLEAYEDLLMRHSSDYTAVDHRNTGKEAIAAFFSPDSFEMKTFPNHQSLDFEGLKGRCLSSSYVPAPDTPGYDALVAGLREVFDRHQVDGAVIFEYRTNLYYGRLT